MQYNYGRNMGSILSKKITDPESFAQILFDAINNAQFDEIYHILEKYPDYSLNLKNHKNINLIQSCVNLCKENLDTNQVETGDKYACLAVDLQKRGCVADLGNFLLSVIRRNQHDIAIYLIKNGVNVNHQDDYSNSVLMFAVSSKLNNLVEVLLSDYAIEINAINYKAKSALHYCVDGLNYKYVELLMQNGCDLGLQFNDHRNIFVYINSRLDSPNFTNKDELRKMQYFLSTLYNARKKHNDNGFVVDPIEYIFAKWYFDQEENKDKVKLEIKYLKNYNGKYTDSLKREELLSFINKFATFKKYKSDYILKQRLNNSFIKCKLSESEYEVLALMSKRVPFYENHKRSFPKGGTSIVRPAISELSEKLTAVKVSLKSASVDDRWQRTFDREAAVIDAIVPGATHFTRMRERNIPGHYILTPFHKGIELYYLDLDGFKDPNIQKNLMYNIVYKLALEIQRISNLGYIHRDIKPENVIIDVNCQGELVSLNLIDYGFGFGVGLDNIKNDSVCGTPAYSPPECFTITSRPGDSNVNYVQSSNSRYHDIWSLGQVIRFLNGPSEKKNRANQPSYACECISDKPLNDAWLSSLASKIESFERITIDRVVTQLEDEMNTLGFLKEDIKTGVEKLQIS
jgi:hypothetical protein